MRLTAKREREIADKLAEALRNDHRDAVEALDTLILELATDRFQVGRWTGCALHRWIEANPRYSPLVFTLRARPHPAGPRDRQPYRTLFYCPSNGRNMLDDLLCWMRGWARRLNRFPIATTA